MQTNCRAGQIYKTAGYFIIHPMNQTVTGIGLASEPVSRLPSTSTPEQVGEAVLAALAAWRDGVSHPEVWAGFGRQLLTAAGFGSWRALEKASVCCGFYDDGATLSFDPMGHADDGGFIPEEGPKICISSTSPPAIVGRAALEALTRAK